MTKREACAVGRMWIWIAAALILSAGQAWAQGTVPAEVAEHGYADGIYINGKIVSMDDQGYNSNPGTIYQAMAVKKDRIMALGTTVYVRTLANANTRIYDLQGMTVIPGLIDTHNHNFGGQIGPTMGINAPDTGIAVRVEAGKDMETTRLRIETAIKDSVAKVKPGDWINVGINENQQEGISSNRIFSWVGRGELEPKERLNRIAPDNPVIVQQASRATMNEKGWEVARSFLPFFDDYAEEEISEVPESNERGLIAVGEETAMTWNIFYRNQPQARLAEMVRRSWERLAAQGITTFASRVHNPRILDTVTYLHREMDQPVRFGALYEVHRKPEDPAFVRKFYSYTGNLTGVGDDYLWIHGVASELWDSSFPQSCLGPDLPAPPLIKLRELCPKPGVMYWDVLETALKNGWRLAGVHGLASDGVRRFTQLMDKVVKETSITAEDIRKLRPTVEHVEALGYVPDVMAKVKEYGIILNVNPPRLVREKEYIQDYGPKAEEFMMPVKKWLDNGFTVVGHFEGGAVGSTMNNLIRREVNGRVVLPDQKLDRVVVMKLFTTWAPLYMLKEKVLGTLQIGKMADFVVLDKDFFTIPDTDIPTIRPQMTVVGGITRFVHPDLARTWGMQPVGYQFPAGAYPWRAGGGG
ncbi:MAG: amidohydrolase family protein [Acidobacteria bacterium]|nr:amidohydrolase family protein [Acidobacteriota bacterium]